MAGTARPSIRPSGDALLTRVRIRAAIARMSRVRATLEAARVPVSEERSAKSGGAPGAHVSLVVMGCARLPFPYTADACECANEIVLSRVRELVASVQ